jgi:hypothetical protein
MILCSSLAKKPIRETAVFNPLENGYEKHRKERAQRRTLLAFPLF